MNVDEHYLLCLSEECDEVGQRVSKALRFGLSEVQKNQPLTNAERIVEELQDLFSVASIIAEKGLIPTFVVDRDTIEAKRAKIEKFMAISREQGVL